LRGEIVSDRGGARLPRAPTWLVLGLERAGVGTGGLLGSRTGHGVAVFVNFHPQRQPHGRQDLLDLVQRLAAEVLGLQHLVLSLLDELADGLDIGVLQAVVAAHGELKLLDGAIEVLVADFRLALLFSGRRLQLLLEVDKDIHVVFQQLRGESDGVSRGDRAVGPDFQGQLVVIGDLAQARGFDGVIALAHRRVHGVNGNEADAEVLVKVLVGGDIAAAALKAHLHVELASFADGGDVRVRIEHFDVGIGVDHAAGDYTRLLGTQINGLGALAAKLERHLLQVEDDVGRVFDHSGDGLELVQHAFNFDRGDRCALDRGEQHAPQRIADGGAEAAFEGLRPEAAVLVAERLGVYREALGFLKTFPKNHGCLLRPCCSRPAPVPRRIKLRLYRPRPGPGASHMPNDGGSGSNQWALNSLSRFRVSRFEMRPFHARYRTGAALIVPGLGLETEPQKLLTVQLDDQLLVHRQVNVFALGQREHASLEVFAIHLQPRRYWLVAAELHRLLDCRLLAAGFAHRDLVTGLNLVGRNVHLAPVHLDVAVTHELARLAAGRPEAQPKNNVVQPPLKLLQQHFTRDSLGAGGFLVVVAELVLADKVDALGLLLLAKLQAIADDLRLAVFTVLAGGEVALLHRAFVGKALRALEEQLHALAAAKAAYCVLISCQFASPCGIGLRDWRPFVPIAIRLRRIAPSSRKQLKSGAPGPDDMLFNRRGR